MTVASLPQPVNFNRADLLAAIHAALGKLTDDRWTRAIYRAAANLAAGQFSYDGRMVILHSATSSKVYRIDTREPMQCSCKAHERGLLCWHISAARLLVRAAEHHAAPRPRKSYAELQAAVDELFS